MKLFQFVIIMRTNFPSYPSKSRKWKDIERGLCLQLTPFTMQLNGNCNIRLWNNLEKGIQNMISRKDFNCWPIWQLTIKRVEKLQRLEFQAPYSKNLELGYLELRPWGTQGLRNSGTQKLRYSRTQELRTQEPRSTDLSNSRT